MPSGESPADESAVDVFICFIRTTKKSLGEMDPTRPGFSDNVAASLSSEGRGFSFELHHFYEWIRD